MKTLTVSSRKLCLGTTCLRHIAALARLTTREAKEPLPPEEGQDRLRGRPHRGGGGGGTLLAIVVAHHYKTSGTTFSVSKSYLSLNKGFLFTRSSSCAEETRHPESSDRNVDGNVDGFFDGNGGRREERGRRDGGGRREERGRRRRRCGTAESPAPRGNLIALK